MPELIDRQSALSVCKEYGWNYDDNFIDGYNAAIKDTRAAIKKLPAIDAQPVRHGRWECGGFCSECGIDNEERKTDYCPHCGARMDGGDEA